MMAFPGVWLAHNYQRRVSPPVNCISTSTAQHGQRAKANADFWPVSCFYCPAIPFYTRPPRCQAMPQRAIFHTALLQPILPRKDQTSWTVSETHADHEHSIAGHFPRTKTVSCSCSIAGLVCTPGNPSTTEVSADFWFCPPHLHSSLAFRPVQLLESCSLDLCCGQIGL